MNKYEEKARELIFQAIDCLKEGIDEFDFTAEEDDLTAACVARDFSDRVTLLYSIADLLEGKLNDD